MMKKKLFSVMLLISLFAAAVSCRKNDETMMSVNADEKLSEVVVQDASQLTRAVDPSQTIANLAQEYGWIYDFDSVYFATPASHSSVVFYSVQSMWTSWSYLTFVLNGSANVIGLYVIDFSDLRIDGFGSDYTVWPVLDNHWLFYGTLNLNVPGAIPDYLTVSNNISIPSDYPYPLFANVTSGSFVLPATTIYPHIYGDPNNVVSVPEGTRYSLYSAAIFYANFYE